MNALKSMKRYEMGMERFGAGVRIKGYFLIIVLKNPETPIIIRKIFNL